MARPSALTGGSAGRSSERESGRQTGSLHGFMLRFAWCSVARLAVFVVVGFQRPGGCRRREGPGALAGDGVMYDGVKSNTPPGAWPAGRTHHFKGSLYRSWSGCQASSALFAWGTGPGRPPVTHHPRARRITGDTIARRNRTGLRNECHRTCVTMSGWSFELSLARGVAPRGHRSCYVRLLE